MSLDLSGGPASLLSVGRALVESRRHRARRWFCDRPDCDGRPHQGFLHRHARAKQRPPSHPWRVWVLLGGRGAGKSRAGSELVKDWVSEPGQQIAVVGRTETLVREICFEHRRSGLLAVLDPDLVKSYRASPGNITLTLTNGSVIRGFGAEVPDNLRGWEFDRAWADEFAAWSRHRAQDSWDMLWFCLREAATPQVVVTTTPKALPHVTRLVRRARAQLERLANEGAEQQPTVVVTTAHTLENRDNLSESALAEYEDTYAGTRLGDQELGGLLLEDVDGALWTRALFEDPDFRIPPIAVPALDRIVVAVDPATTTSETADESGIAVAGRSGWRDVTHEDQRPRGYLLHTENTKLTPAQTMARAAELYHLHQADAVVLEANNGGEYLSTVLQMIDPTVPFRIVHATRDKRARATPVAALYEQGRWSHVGDPRDFDALETTMTTYAGVKDSDLSLDALDAFCWAAWDLFLDPATASPRPTGRRAGGDPRLYARR